MEIEVNDKNFEERVIEGSKKIPIVVDFWAELCGPCNMLGPILEKFAEEMDGKFILAKLDTDESPKTSQDYKISGIPAVKMFKDGKVVDEFVGAIPEGEVKLWLDKNTK